MKKRITSIILTLCLLLTLLPTAALAEGTQITTALDFSSATTNLTGAGYAWVNSSKTLTITDLNLNVTDSNALTLPAGSKLVLEGSNTITSTGDLGYYGINMPNGGVTVEGTGSLTVSGKSAGIYTNGIYPSNGITINSGNITAIATYYSGNGINCVSGSIDIAGGVVTALGKPSSDYGYGIKGSGVKITGGYVYANGVKVGASTNLNDAQPTGGIVFNAATIDTSGNVTSKGAGSFYGSATLTENMTLQAGESLSFSVNSTLSFAEGITLTLAGGTVGLKSDLDVTDYSGKIIGNGTIKVGDTPYTVKDGTIIVPKATLTPGTPTVSVTTATIPLTTDGTKLYYTNNIATYSNRSAHKIKSDIGSQSTATCNQGTVTIGTDKSLSLTGLTQGRDYTYYLVAENAGGYLSDVVGVNFKTLLPTPTAANFSVTGLERGTEYSYTDDIRIIVQAANGVTGVGGATLCYKKQNADGSGYGELRTGQPKDVGTYKLYAKVVAGASYAAVDELDLNETVTITKGTLTATMLQLSANSFLYDGEVKKPTVSLSSAHSGAGTFTTKYYSDSKCTAEVSEPKEVGTYYVGVTATEGTNFNAVTMPLAIAFEIKPVANSITLTCADICYGEQPDPKAEATCPTGFTYTYSKNEAGPYTSTLPDSVGTWWVKVTAAATETYASAEQTTSFQVKKMPLTPYVVGVTSRAYDGTTDGSGSLSLKDKNGNTIASKSARASGTFTWTSANAGTSTVNVSNIALDVTSVSNYELSTTSLENVTAPNGVSIAKHTIIANIGSVTKTYDGTTDVPENALTVSFGGAVSSGDTVAVTVSGTFDRTDKGEGTVTLGTPTVTGTNAENYEIIMPKTVNGTINRRHVLVTVNPGQGKAYGQADPVLTYTVTAANGLTGGGLIGGDTIPYAPVRAAGEAAGSYEITRGRIPDYYYNYAIDGFTGGTFTISKAVVTASADSKTMTVGGTLPAFTVSYAGIVSGDTADGIFKTKSTAACTADGKTAGSFDITLTAPVLTEEAAANYTVGTPVPGKLTVSAPSSSGGGSTAAPTTNTDSKTTTNTDGSTTKVDTTTKTDSTGATTTTEVKTTTNTDGTTTKTETATTKKTDTATGAVTETTTQKTVDATGKTQTVEQAKTVVTDKATGAKTEIVAEAKTTADGTTTKVETVKVAGGTDGVTAEAKVETGKTGEAVATALIEAPATATTTTLPAAVVEAVTKADTAEVTVKVGEVSVALDKTAVEAVKATGGEAPVISATPVAAKELPTELQSATKAYDFKVSGKGVNFGGGSAVVSVPYTKADPAKAVAVYHIDANGSKTRVYGATLTAGKLNIPTTGWSTYAVLEVAPLAFTDVSDTNWFYGSVQYAADNNLFKGTTATTFGPAITMDRAMLVTVLYRMAGSPAVTDKANFSDAAADAYYADAVAWASANKLVTGFEDGSFRPNIAVTREQMVAILYRYAVHKSTDTSTTSELTAFTDAANVSSYATAAVKWAVGAKLLNGSDGKLSPADGASRAEVAAILMRFGQSNAK